MLAGRGQTQKGHVQSLLPPPLPSLHQAKILSATWQCCVVLSLMHSFPLFIVFRFLRYSIFLLYSEFRRDISSLPWRLKSYIRSYNRWGHKVIAWGHKVIAWGHKVIAWGHKVIAWHKSSSLVLFQIPPLSSPSSLPLSPPLSPPSLSSLPLLPSSLPPSLPSPPPPPSLSPSLPDRILSQRWRFYRPLKLHWYSPAPSPSSLHPSLPLMDISISLPPPLPPFSPSLHLHLHLPRKSNFLSTNLSWEGPHLYFTAIDTPTKNSFHIR